MCAMQLGLGLGLSKKIPGPITAEDLAMTNELSEKIESFLQTLNDTSELAEEALEKFNIAVADQGLDVPALFEKMEQLLTIINQV